MEVVVVVVEVTVVVTVVVVLVVWAEPWIFGATSWKIHGIFFWNIHSISIVLVCFHGS